jgi:DNA-binding XRE family transcriptional regulator
MLAVVKTPHIEIRGEELTADFLALVRGHFKAPVEVFDDDEAVDWFSTELHESIAKRKTPGSTVFAYRHREAMTQVQLAQKLGVSKQVVCELEKDRRPMSAATARKLSEVFQTGLATWLAY